MNTLSQSLAGYAASINFNSLRGEVVHEVKRRLIDSLGCAFGAMKSRPFEIVRGVAENVVAAFYTATILSTNRRTTPDLAAFANGILIRYLDYNDTYLSNEPAHPSDNISSALAVAEAEVCDGKALLTAIALGYEVQCRLCDAASLRLKGWDHVAYLSISSAILSSRLMNLDMERMSHAIALSITPNIPLRQTRVGELSMWKGCAAGNAARNGVFSAMLAKGGMTGPSEVFEGKMGLFNQVTGSFSLDVDSFGGRDGDFKLLHTYIKRYPSEYHSQAAIEAALKLRSRVKAEDIEEINIETYDACIDIIADEEKWHPETRETADHSLPYCVAVALMDGRVGLEQFSEERIKDPSIKALMGKIKVERNPEHTRQYPEAFPCKIEIKTRAGDSFSETVASPKGHPENPMSDREVEEKFTSLSEEFLGKSRVREILNTIWGLEEIKDVKELMLLCVVSE